jgi:hypothetical protein
MIRRTGSRGVNMDCIVCIALPLRKSFLLMHLKDKQAQKPKME